MTENPIPPDSPSPSPDSPRIIEARELVHQVAGEHSLRVISRLVRTGFEAYLVGGCVRDLLVGVVPKDFDVATSAHPRQVRRLFPRNSHIIGRRFRLVHIRYGKDSVIETATFRKEPIEKNGDDDDLLIVEDNTYGTAAEDARRRDFTVNGLFLDPTEERVIDFVGGLEDLDAGILRTIGNPFVRIPEDPVRIIRAIKFATRLGLHIEKDTWRAMCEYAPELARSAPPRVLEEVLRLMRSGTALGSFEKMRQCGVLRTVLPQVDDHLGPLEDSTPEEQKRAAAFWRLLGALDAAVQEGLEPTTPVCLAVLYHDIARRQAHPMTRTLPGPPPEMPRVAEEVLEGLFGNPRLSRRDSTRARRIIVQQHNFTRPSGRRFRPRLFCLSEEFPEALALFRLRTQAKGEGYDIYRGWKERYEAARGMGAEQIDEERRQARRPRRRKRTKSKRRPD